MQYSLKSLQRALAHTLDRPLHGIDLLRPFCNDRVCGSNTDQKLRYAKTGEQIMLQSMSSARIADAAAAAAAESPLPTAKKIAWPFWTSGKAPFPSYDTIRDAILTCARKPTWVGLIYRTETTTKNCKTEKLKSKRRYVRSNSKSLGNHVVSS